MFSKSLILFMMLPHGVIAEVEVEKVVGGQVGVVTPLEHAVLVDLGGVLGAPIGVPLKCRLRSGC